MHQQKHELNRRQFVGTVATGAAFGSLSLTQQPTHAANQSETIREIVQRITDDGKIENWTSFSSELPLLNANALVDLDKALDSAVAKVEWEALSVMYRRVRQEHNVIATGRSSPVITIFKGFLETHRNQLPQIYNTDPDSVHELFTTLQPYLQREERQQVKRVLGLRGRLQSVIRADTLLNNVQDTGLRQQARETLLTLFLQLEGWKDEHAQTIATYRAFQMFSVYDEVGKAKTILDALMKGSAAVRGTMISMALSLIVSFAKKLKFENDPLYRKLMQQINALDEQLAKLELDLLGRFYQKKEDSLPPWLKILFTTFGRDKDKQPSTRDIHTLFEATLSYHRADISKEDEFQEILAIYTQIAKLESSLLQILIERHKEARDTDVRDLFLDTLQKLIALKEQAEGNDRALISDAIEELLSFYPQIKKLFNKLSSTKPSPDVRSTETRDASGNPVIGVEAGPITANMLTPALIGAARQRWRGAINIVSLLPTTGPSGTTPTEALTVDQMLTHGNAFDARAREFRTNVYDLNTTKSVVVIAKTRMETYKHDYHICARFHQHTLDDVISVPVPRPGTQESDSNAPWFWFSRVYDNRTGASEAACTFTVLVNEESHQLTVDSRWVDKQYSPHWHNPRGKQYNYMLNFQIWSYSADETLKLVRSVLSKLESLPGNWNITYANQNEPIQPIVYVEEAWLTNAGTMYLSLWNRSWTPRMVCFHGTARSSPNGKDTFFEGWEAVYPGRNMIQLQRHQLEWRTWREQLTSAPARIDNAVIHCEVEGFMDKVYVSVDRQRPAPRLVTNPFAKMWQTTAPHSKIKIMWPPAGAKVPVLRDQLDMPDDDNGTRVAVWGIVPGAGTASLLKAWVFTNDWYPHERLFAVHNGLWGFRAYLSGRGQFNNHSIYVGLYNASGKAIAHDEVKQVQRIDPWKDSNKRKSNKKIIVHAKDIRIDHRSHRWDDGTITIGGGPEGPRAQGGAAQFEITLPNNASALKLRMSIWHGTEQQHGKGIHSTNQGGTATVYINSTPVHKFVCQHQHKNDDWWPDPEAELGHTLREVDLQTVKAKGKTVIVTIVASPGTCMDIRTFNITPVPTGSDNQ